MTEAKTLLERRIEETETFIRQVEMEISTLV